MNDQQFPKFTATETLIMTILLDDAGGEIYGWELMEKSNCKLKRGTVYVILNRMEDKGFIKSRKELPRKGARGQPRRLYKPTGFGKQIFSAWEMIQKEFQLLERGV